MKTIVTTKKNRINKTCVFSGGLQVSFDEKLQAEVKDENVDELLELDPSLSIIVGEQKSTGNKGGDKGDGKKDDEGGNEESEEIREMRKGLDVMTVVDLRSMVDQMPKKEWKNLKKADLIEYIIIKSQEEE